MKKSIDFLDKMEVPPVYRRWTQFSRICTCGRRIGVLQRKKEEEVTMYLNQGMTLQEANIKWLRDNNIVTMCCLRDYTYPPKDKIYDCVIGALSDITTDRVNNERESVKINKQNVRTRDDSGVAGYEFMYKTRNLQDFGMVEYSRMLVADSLSTFDKMEVLRRDGSLSSYTNAIPSFPNYSVSRSEDMPTIVSDIPLLTPQELTLSELMRSG